MLLATADAKPPGDYPKWSAMAKAGAADRPTLRGLCSSTVCTRTPRSSACGQEASMSATCYGGSNVDWYRSPNKRSLHEAAALECAHVVGREGKPLAVGVLVGEPLVPIRLDASGIVRRDDVHDVGLLG
jgi:hypothetical protein